MSRVNPSPPSSPPPTSASSTFSRASPTAVVASQVRGAPVVRRPINTVPIDQILRQRIAAIYYGTITDLLGIRNQLKVFHWGTKLYPLHLNLDKLDEHLETFIDKFVETASGVFDLTPAVSTTEPVRSPINLKNENIEEDIVMIQNWNTELADYFERLRRTFNNKLADVPGIGSLINLIEEMQGHVFRNDYLERLY